jgi:hypothetical protein
MPHTGTERGEILNRLDQQQVLPAEAFAILVSLWLEEGVSLQEAYDQTVATAKNFLSFGDLRQNPPDFASIQEAFKDDPRSRQTGRTAGLGGVTGQAGLADRLEAQRIKSETRAGRRGLFRDFATTQLADRGVTGLGFEIANRRFDPLSAQFVLNQALNPNLATGGGQGNFRSFIPGQALPTAQDFQTQFEQLAPLFSAVPGALTENQAAQRAALTTDPEVGENIITQAVGAGINPFLRQFLPNILASRFAGFREQDPTTNVFEQFARGGFSF